MKAIDAAEPDEAQKHLRTHLSGTMQRTHPDLGRAIRSISATDPRWFLAGQLAQRAGPRMCLPGNVRINYVFMPLFNG